jgi:hypothetical protein
VAPARRAAVQQGKENPIMAKVYGLHRLQLREGVKPEEFEKFVIQEWYALPQPEGTSSCLLKGVKGRDEGKYLLMIEVESVERYKQLYPSEEIQQWLQTHAAVWDKLQSMTMRIYTDYVVVSK